MTDYGCKPQTGFPLMVRRFLVAISVAIPLAGPLLASDEPDVSRAELLICPTCNDGNACTTDYCETATNQCHHIPVVCEDYSPCTTDGCHPVLGCQFVPHPDGEACTDGNLCTTGDHCQSGACQGTDVDCNDGNACTIDYCDFDNGQCLHVIYDCSDQNPCTTDVCNPATGQCQYTPLPNGSPCDDLNPCTTTSHCVLERNNVQYCIGTDGTPGAPCNDANNCTINDRCLPVGVDGTLRCTGTYLSCEDGTACTLDYCDYDTGQCQHRLLGCDDSNPCTTDSCNPQTGCQWVPVPLGTPCEDRDFCTINDVCIEQSGYTFCRGTPNVGMPCDDGNPCTVNTYCVPPGNGSLCQGQYLTCEDGNPCTSNLCQEQGQCVVVPMQCNDFNPCTYDECRIAQGGCQNSPREDGSACNDNSACTLTDACQAGNCTGIQLDCDDGNPCTQDYCDGVGCGHYTSCSGADNEACTSDACDPQTGQCLFTPLPNGTLCFDSDPCTANGMCNMGICQGTPVTCNDGNSCTDDSCMFGCQNVSRPDGSQCNDGIACTQFDQCTAGECYGQPINCPDGDPCTIDSCEPQTGLCQHAPVTFSEVTPIAFIDDDTLQWTPSPAGGPRWNTYRGSIPMLTLGSRLPLSVYDHVCYESADAFGDGPTTSTDASLPASGTAWYYDVTEENDCGEGPLGSSSAGVVRPNASPCPTPP